MAASQESRIKEYSRTLRLIGLMYLAAGGVSFFFPDKIFFVLNYIPERMEGYTVLPFETGKFWLVIATSFIVSWGIFFFFAAQYPTRKTFQSVVLIQPLITGGAFGYLYFYDVSFFAYIAACASQVLILLAILWKWMKILFSRKSKSLDSTDPAYQNPLVNQPAAVPASSYAPPADSFSPEPQTQTQTRTQTRDEISLTENTPTPFHNAPENSLELVRPEDLTDPDLKPSETTQEKTRSFATITRDFFGGGTKTVTGTTDRKEDD